MSYFVVFVDFPKWQSQISHPDRKTTLTFFSAALIPKKRKIHRILFGLETFFLWGRVPWANSNGWTCYPCNFFLQQTGMIFIQKSWIFSVLWSFQPIPLLPALKPNPGCYYMQEVVSEVSLTHKPMKTEKNPKYQKSDKNPLISGPMKYVPFHTQHEN